MSSFMKFFVGILLLVIETAFIICTAFVGPLRLRPHWVAYALYTLSAIVVWFLYAIAMMFADAALGNDVPGFGYVALGFISWVVGSVIFVSRILRKRPLH